VAGAEVRGIGGEQGAAAQQGHRLPPADLSHGVAALTHHRTIATHPVRPSACVSAF
jgi:hypothetical protein